MLQTSAPSGHENMVPLVYLRAIISAMRRALAFPVFNSPKNMQLKRLKISIYVISISFKVVLHTYQIQGCVAEAAKH